MFDALLTSDDILSATAPRAWVDAMVQFELALAQAQEELGILDPGSADAVASAAARARLTPSELAVRGRSSGNPVVAMVRAIADAGEGNEVPVHHGATSQDAMDTAAMLVSAAAGALVLDDLGRAAQACAALVEDHRFSLMTGRTLLQPAVPLTFGLKAAGWLVALTEGRTSLAWVVGERLAVQLGGAAGTMASFGTRGPELSARLAARLGLHEPLLPWHTDRSRIVELGAALVTVANACAKIALDVVLLSQAELGEVAEGGEPGRGGSSTMPHKANAVGSVSILAAARHAHGALTTLVAAGVQDHERAGTGGWHAEWEALSGLLRASGGCAANTAALLAGLRVDTARMAGNVADARGLVVTEHVALDLGPDLGRRAATELVRDASAEAVREDRSLRDVLGTRTEVAALRTPEQLDALCDPAAYLGAAEQLCDRALSLHAAAGSAPHRSRKRP